MDRTLDKAPTLPSAFEARTRTETAQVAGAIRRALDAGVNSCIELNGRACDGTVAALRAAGYRVQVDGRGNHVIDWG